MRLEIPELTRCCFFVPLRYGIMIFGYLNLLFAGFICGAYIHYLNKNAENVTMISDVIIIYKGVGFFAHVWLTFFLYFVEVIFCGILLVGVHMKRPFLIQLFYYYSIATILASIAIFIIDISINTPMQFIPLDYATIFCGFVIQIYLILLVRSELSKLRYHGDINYVNHVPNIEVQLNRGEGPS
ncbi:uncharacterized protein LOC114244392 [Bombyx mandarina]|uniref:Uncharacterized protein n=2 Tax=Bombyx TaxID=7090 RepID=A0A8R1WHX1_BOMMO|nr:uncharacterized protein LOC101737067 [Bombyx mori]XP_028031986.1 uncharacterized protein LOC114244392 [Bombyx mandarina]